MVGKKQQMARSCHLCFLLSTGLWIARAQMPQIYNAPNTANLKAKHPRWHRTIDLELKLIFFIPITAKKLFETKGTCKHQLHQGRTSPLAMLLER